MQLDIIQWRCRLYFGLLQPLLITDTVESCIFLHGASPWDGSRLTHTIGHRQTVDRQTDRHQVHTSCNQCKHTHRPARQTIKTILHWHCVNKTIHTHSKHLCINFLLLNNTVQATTILRVRTVNCTAALTEFVTSRFYCTNVSCHSYRI